MPIDPDRQRQAKQYARLRHRLLAVEVVAAGVALIVVLVSGLSVWLREIVFLVSRDVWISTALYFVVGFVGYELLFSPLAFYSYRLSRRYGLSTQSVGAWLKDAAKAGALGIAFGAIVIEVIYFVLRVAPQWWWLCAAGIMLVFDVLLTNLAPVLIAPLFYKFTPLADEELVARLMDLAARAKTRVRGVFTIALSGKTTAANAALMGLGNTRRIVLGDTLYQDYTHDEIETILAHELAHHVHKDIPLGIALESALTLVGFFVADWVLRAGVEYWRFAEIGDLGAMPLFALALGVYGLVTMPLGNAFSRWREANADRYALDTTRNPAAFIGAMEKLANQNLAEVEPEPWVEFLLYTHPPIGKRLEMGHRFAQMNSDKRIAESV
jgi:STE24 endopeptidase